MKNLWRALAIVWRCDRWAMCRSVFYVLLQSIVPLLNIYFLKRLIDVVEAGVRAGGGWDGVVPWLVAMAVTYLVGRLVRTLDGINSEVLAQHLADYVSGLMHQQAARLDLAYYDTPSYHDTYHRAQQEAATRPVAIMNNAMATAGAAISALGATLMLCTASWWVVAVMVVAVVPGFVVRLRKAQRIYAFRRDNTQLFRRATYFNHLLTSREAAKEMRAYRLAPLFRERYVAVRQRIVDRIVSIVRLNGMADMACAAIEALALLLVVGMLAHNTLSGALTIGSFVMLFEAFRRGQGYLSALVAGVAGLYDNRLFVSNLFEFLGMQPTVVAPADPLPLPEKIESVELRDVSFRYPDMDRDVLSHFSLRAEVGKPTRIEGENGRGKTTVVKLLLRMYDPQEGTVLINGIDVRRFDPEQLRTRFGVLFQDFARFQCTLEENVSLGDVEHPDRPVDEALAKADGTKVAERLPQGAKTQLGRMFDGGRELSMGQWQRVALARALQADAQVLVLDEPTAWLDVEARRHLEAVVEAESRSKVVLVISHQS